MLFILKCSKKRIKYKLYNDLANKVLLDNLKTSILSNGTVVVSHCEAYRKNNIVYISLNCYANINLDGNKWIVLGALNNGNAPSVVKQFPVACANNDLNIIGQVNTDGTVGIKSIGTNYIANSPITFTISYPL